MSRAERIWPLPEVAADRFRAAMRALPSGVALLTAGRGAAISGMTVSSFSSLSAEPPRVIACVNRTASSLPLIEKFRVFGISIPTAAQRDVAERFGNRTIKAADRFAEAQWITLASGVPLLAGAATAIDCSAEDIIERHSHAILIGRVLDLRTADASSALAYWRGEYVAHRDEDARPG